MRCRQDWLGRLQRALWAPIGALVLIVGVAAPASQAATTIPPAPTGLVVIGVGHDRVQLQWEGARTRHYRIHWQVAG